MQLLLVLLSLAAVAHAVPLPDLVIDKAELAASLIITKDFENDACYVNGGCIPSVGTHTLLRFATRTHNHGDADLVIGPPPTLVNQGKGLQIQNTMSATGIIPTWEWHQCHNHWHMVGYVEAQLFYASNMEVAAVTAKHSFCLRDSSCKPGAVGQFGCDNQGISVNCSDVYGVNTACQWIVLPPTLPMAQEYVLRLTVDPENFIPESNETNNQVEVRLTPQDLVSCATAKEIEAVMWIALLYWVHELLP